MLTATRPARKSAQPVKPYEITNAACVRCDAGAWFDPATHRVYCPKCEARRAIATLIPTPAVKATVTL